MKFQHRAPRLSPSWIAYERIKRLSASKRQLQKFHNLLDERMTPEEVRDFSHNLGSRRCGLRRLWLRATLEAQRLDWVGALRRQVNLAKLEAPRYRRLETRNSHILFSLPEQRNRLLVVGWTGQKSRLMMPSALFLGALATIQADLLLFRYRPNGSIWTGRVGDGEADQPGVAIIERITKALSYSRVSILGVSLGTIPALECSAAIGCEKVAIVGFSDWKTFIPGFEEQQLLMKLTADRINPSARPSYSFTFGKQALIDTTRSLAAAGRLGAKTVSVDSADHSALFTLAMQGKLEGWMKQHLRPED